jgi:multidrug efflux pump subunit AcrA (membrane-fusion protein)
MKKLVLLMAALALCGTVVMAQVQLADIYGTVVLPDGSSIPGVSVSLTSDVGGKMTAVTSEEGNFRFLKLSPGN